MNGYHISFYSLKIIKPYKVYVNAKGESKNRPHSKRGFKLYSSLNKIYINLY